MSPKAKDLSFVKLDPTSPFIQAAERDLWAQSLGFNFPANEKCHIFESYFIMPDRPVCLVSGRLGSAGYIC